MVLGIYQYKTTPPVVIWPIVKATLIPDWYCRMGQLQGKQFFLYAFPGLWPFLIYLVRTCVMQGDFPKTNLGLVIILI